MPETRIKTSMPSAASPQDPRVLKPPSKLSLKPQPKPRGLIYDDYSEGEISLIIDEDLHKSPEANKRRQPLEAKKSAAKEIFGEGDSGSNDGMQSRGKQHNKVAQDEKKGFRIKKELKGGYLNKQQETHNPVTDMANVTGGFKYKLGDLESKFNRNKIDSRIDQNVRVDHRTEMNMRKTITESLKEVPILDKNIRQTEFEKELRAKYTSFYNSNPKEVLRSNSQNVNKLQNNFLRTTNGFYSTKNHNTSRDKNREEEKEASNTGRDKDMRRYDKPWLMNSTNRDLGGTQTVVLYQQGMAPTICK